MTRGPVSEQAIEWALLPAMRRGTVYFFQRDRERPCDFQIVNSNEVVFVAVKRTRCLHRPLQELETECHEQVLRLRAVPVFPSILRELWVCSRNGRWRFFSVTAAGMDELPVPVPRLSPEPVAA